METIKTVISALTGGGGDKDDNSSTPGNEQIRHQLCNVDELQNGQMKEFEIKTSLVDASVLLIRQDNKFHAYSNKCCHYKLPLSKGLNTDFL
jgi:nitrite reductase/ring-hydroxylating ferredoxin subunit